MNPIAGRVRLLIALVALTSGFAGCTADESTLPDGVTADGQPEANRTVPGFDRLKHVVVIYLENHSFDNLYGEFPGADGLSNASATSAQVDLTGTPFTTLPFPATTPFTPFPTDLPNAPFSIEQYVPAAANTPDLVHRYYQEQQQIDGGKMDKVAAVSDAKGLVMGFYHTDHLPLAAEAERYTLCDNFFHAAFGGSFLNHFWLIAARTPVFPSAPAAIVAQLDANGNLVTDGAVTPDGYAVNTLFTVNNPHPSTAAADRLVPNQTFPTIGNRLSAKKISWAWYSGGWDDALAGNADPLFQFHHQPFAFFTNYADGTAAKAEHLLDETEFIAAAEKGTLPAVAFVKPLGEVNEHPGYTNGWGPGARVPTLIISPFARAGFVDHHRYDTTSILAFIEHRFGLAPLTQRDASVNDLTAAFDFEHGPHD